MEVLQHFDTEEFPIILFGLRTHNFDACICTCFTIRYVCDWYLDHSTYYVHPPNSIPTLFNAVFMVSVENPELYPPKGITYFSTKKES